MTVFKFNIVDIIGSHTAISPSKAVILYNHFKNHLKSNVTIEYSFQGLQDCSSAFCNAFVGKIYMDFGQSVKNNISFVGLDNENQIWGEKVHRAIHLGIEENYRNSSQQALEEILS